MIGEDRGVSPGCKQARHRVFLLVEERARPDLCTPVVHPIEKARSTAAPFCILESSFERQVCFRLSGIVCIMHRTKRSDRLQLSTDYFRDEA